MQPKRILIVGGVASGASAATRARRLSEEAEILLFERGPQVSFANCGLPYYIGGEIPREADLLVQTPAGLKARFNLDVRVLTEVTCIDRAAQEVEAKDLPTGRIYREKYDALILSPGATPVRPPIPGIDRPGHFTLRNIPDTLAIRRWIESVRAQRAVVVGGGFIGLELTEQLAQRGLTLALVEALPQVLGMLDVEMAAWLHQELRAHQIDLHLGDGVAQFDAPRADESAAASVVVLQSGVRLPADVVILAMGVKPEVRLAREAGLELGELGGIRVNDRLQTSDPHIWAVGDAIEIRHGVTGEWRLIPLAGPANRQGRLAAENALGGDSRYEGTWGTGIVRLFGLTVAATGADAKTLRRLNIPHRIVHLHPRSHASYYPGAEPIALKLLFAPETGRLLGAQAVGREGVDKRIDVLATALKAGMTVSDLAQLELAYAPPFGAAKDPINLAGMAAENVVQGRVEVIQWNEITGTNPMSLLLDVREPEEWEAGHIPGAISIPLSQLRARLSELPVDREIDVYCQTGQRGYYACRLLSQHGFSCRNLTGAYRTWAAAANEFAK